MATFVQQVRADQDSTTPWVNVAIGILLRHLDTQPEVLLAERSQEQYYAGFWEFPGGKVEPGEHPDATLKRELREELAIEVTSIYPWGGPRHFIYPHARVRLFFYRVTAWEGTLGPNKGAEGQKLAWFKFNALPEETLLPANRPLLRFMRAPSYLLITDVIRYSEKNLLARLDEWLQQPAPFILQIRDKTLADKERKQWGQRLLNHVKTRRQDCPVLWNGSPQHALEQGYDGVHCPQSVWQDSHFRWPEQMPASFWKSASCHNKEDLIALESLSFDSATYSPVLPTATHPEASALGWSEFAQAALEIPLPLFALGGLHKKDQRLAWQHGAHGIALCSAAWASSDE